MRRHGQRNMSDNNSAYAALISNITEKDRAKDVEQFDGILRTFTNEMNKFECRFGKISDEEKMFTVKKLMPESSLKLQVQRYVIVVCTSNSSSHWRSSSLTRYRRGIPSYRSDTVDVLNEVLDKALTLLHEKRHAETNTAHSFAMLKPFLEDQLAQLN